MSEKQYRDLEVGEVLQEGDEYNDTGTGWCRCWMNIGRCIEATWVCEYRRPITSSPEGETKIEVNLANNPKLQAELETIVDECSRAEHTPVNQQWKSSPTTEPVVRKLEITERHLAYYRELIMCWKDAGDNVHAQKATLLNLLAKHFPEPASDWIEMAAEEIADRVGNSLAEKDRKKVAAIITRHMKGEGA
jgi:hypothetical protein